MFKGISKRLVVRTAVLTAMLGMGTAAQIARAADEPAPAPQTGDTAPAYAFTPGESDFLLGSPSHNHSTQPPAGTMLMRLLGQDKAGAPLHDTGLSLTGYIQGGYTYNPDRNSGDTNFGRFVDDNGDGNAPVLDQVELSLRRLAARDRFDIGGRIEVIYGYDTARFHANGMNFYGNFCLSDPTESDRANHDPSNQFDITQAYLDLNFQVGTGLLVRVGKFVSPLGYETIDPTSTPFYSRSYLFGFAQPFTLTGVLGNYRLDDQWQVWGGVVRGWDQALNDTNDSVSFVGRIDYRPNARWFLSAGLITGREGNCCDSDCPNGDGTRTLVDVIATYALADQWMLGAEALYGRSSGADANQGTAEWYGVAGYLSWYAAPSVTVNLRGEWFRDVDGTRLLTGSTTEVSSATLGVAFSPFTESRALSGLKIQPEVRYDHATTPEFDSGTRKDQFTVGVSVLYAF